MAQGSGSGEECAVVILAGGLGRRMGGGKPFRHLGDRPLLEWACAQAGRWATDVAIAGAGEGHDDRHWLADPAGIEGPLAGLASALAFARSRDLDAVLTIACDTPFLPDDLPDRLLAAMSQDEDAAVPDCGGRLHPTSAVWRVRIEPTLLDYAASGRRSLLGLIDRVPHVRVPWQAERVDPFFNINTAEDLDQAEAWLTDRER